MASPRICPICKLGLRDGTGITSIRLKEGDKPGVEIGLYAACSDCTEEHRKRVAKKRPPMITAQVKHKDGTVSTKLRGKKAEEISNEELG